MEPGFNIGVKSAESRKKRRDGVLEDNIGSRKLAAAKMLSSHSWGFETDDTTESDSVDMEKECLVEETSFDHGNGGAFAGEKSEQISKSSKILTKKALGKPLKKINFLGNDIDNILSDKPVVLSPLLKNLVNVSVRKFFALDISLNNVVRKSTQEKLVVVRRLFSKINGFGGASTPSKFAGIVRATFTSELSLIKATKLATEAKILVNTNLKKSSRHLDRTVVIKKIPVEMSVEAVHAALSEFGVIKSVKIQLVNLWQKAIVEDLYKALFYTLPVRTNAYDIWDFISSVGGKTCVIDHYLIIYGQARCAVVCFESVNSLDAIMGTTPVLKEAHLCWFCISSAVCTKLAAIYAKHSVPVARPVSFGGVSWAKIVAGSSSISLSVQDVLLNTGSSSEMKPTPYVPLELNDRFAALEHSLASLAECIDKLAKRLNTLKSMIFQLSPGCQPLVTLSLQN
ncbi:hypothetical protein G9A89_017320 [Geosiphon pyriformis]|nr:hypothetical protein G9A89_017320 [Geosiphon pyriformis]